MLEEIKNIKTEKKDFRKFGIFVGIILMIIGGILFWKEKENFEVWLIIGIILFVAGLAIPIILRPIYWVWMVFATVLGWFMTRIILGLFFYVIFTSIGLISRLFGKQFIELKWNKKDSTYWNYRSNSVFEKEKYEKQF